MYTRVISEEVGINFKTKRYLFVIILVLLLTAVTVRSVPGTQSAMLWDCLTPTEFFDGSKVSTVPVQLINSLFGLRSIDVSMMPILFDKRPE